MIAPVINLKKELQSKSSVLVQCKLASIVNKSNSSSICCVADPLPVPIVSFRTIDFIIIASLSKQDLILSKVYVSALQ